MKSITVRTKIGKYFTVGEFVPKGLLATKGDKIVIETYKKVSRELVHYLDLLRKLVGHPVIITSGYRPRAYNKKVGGARGSQHIYGRAADIVIPGMRYIEALEAVLKLPFRGIGIYNNGTIHVDVRPLRKDEPRALWCGIKTSSGYEYISFAEGFARLGSLIFKVMKI